jgi:hypothetical protein
MSLKALLLPTLLFGLAAVLVAQEGPTPAEERRAAQISKLEVAREKARLERRASNVRTLRQMQGAWQLIGFAAPELPDSGRQSIGYLLVSDEFLSLEVHMAYFDEAGKELSSFIQTGTYRLNFNTYSDLIATCLIGSIDDGSGLTQAQDPGVLSVYTTDVQDGTLRFTEEDGSRLTFERVARGALTDRLYEKTDWLPGANLRAPKQEQKSK